MSEFILGLPCPVVGVTGPKYSGKTLFAASLAPGVHPDGHEHAGKPRTLFLDNETSATSYSLIADRIDVPAELRKRHGTSAYRPIHAFEWFRELTLQIPIGRYDVIVVDPASDIESGGVDWVREHPAEFGYSAGQFSKMQAVLIDQAKKFWKSIVLDLAARCQVFCFTTHEREKWVNNRPSGEKTPKGMDYLFECASLYLHLGREPDKEGERPKPPFAEVLKSRLAITEVVNNELKIYEALPKRLPVATVEDIRRYVKHPVGKRKSGLKPDEILQDKALTDDERLLIAREKASLEAETATSKLELMRLAAEAQRAPQAGPVASVNVSAAAATTTQSATPQKQDNAPPSNQAPPLATADQVTAFANQLTAAFGTDESSSEKKRAWFNGLFPGRVPPQLNQDEIEFASQQLKRYAELVGTPKPSINGSAPSTDGQRERIRGLGVQLGMTDDQHLAWLKSRGASSYRDMTVEECDARIAELEALMENPVPF